MRFFLLAFPALFSIVNPLGGTFLFLAVTRHLRETEREHLARRVATYSFVMLNASLYVGAYVLNFFGIDMPVLRLAGGLVIALSGWNLLNAGETSTNLGEAAAQAKPAADPATLAFYPLTMPITTGPGTIAVAVSLGTSRPTVLGGGQLLGFLLQATGATLLICVIVYGAYRYSSRISQAMGPTGTSIVLRLAAFLLFCIGIQVAWNGVAELLASVARPVS
jgi:multiple antibiotic resistance protein